MSQHVWPASVVSVCIPGWPLDTDCCDEGSVRYIAHHRWLVSTGLVGPVSDFDTMDYGIRLCWLEISFSLTGTVQQYGFRRTCLVGLRRYIFTGFSASSSAPIVCILPQGGSPRTCFLPVVHRQLIAVDRRSQSLRTPFCRRHTDLRFLQTIYVARAPKQHLQLCWRCC